MRIHQLACSGMGSPFYADLLERMADDVVAAGPVGRFLADQLDTTYEEAVPLRFLGGVHRQVLSGRAPELAARFPSVGGDGDAAAAWPALLSFIDADADAIRDALTRPPQTNEVGRSAALVGGFLVVARDVPVAIDRAGIPDWLARRLDEPAPGRATVVFHSIVWQYLTDTERASAESALETAGTRATGDAPLAWLRLEPSTDLTHTEL